jgi:hypothetical protein
VQWYGYSKMNLWTLEDLKSQIFIFFKQTDNIGNKQNGICFHDRLIDISLAQNRLTNWCCFLMEQSSNNFVNPRVRILKLSFGLSTPTNNFFNKRNSSFVDVLYTN